MNAHQMPAILLVRQALSSGGDYCVERKEFVSLKKHPLFSRSPGLIDEIIQRLEA